MNNDLKRWDDAAEDWINSKHRDFRPYLISPILKNIFGERAGLKILDAGCGDGIYTQLLHQWGSEVIGVDGSNKMVGIAQNKNPELIFRQADLLEKLPFENSSFDGIVSVLVLMSLKSIKTFLQECHRLIKSGSLVIVVKHPAFSDPAMKLYKSVWSKLTFGKPNGLAVDYFSHPTSRNWEKNPQARMLPYYHRTIEEYTNEFFAAGFLTESMYEPNILSQEFLSQNPKMEYATRLPRFLIFKLIKQ